MRYRLLGPVEVIGTDGQVVALSGERERTLLATLGLGAGRPVTMSRLVDALWGEHPPATAANTLQVHVSNLRKKLVAAGAADDLQSVPEGYALRVGPDDIDATVFARLVEGATGDPAEVATRLREALSLWRGPALADVRSDLLQGEKTRLEELRLRALERRIDSELELGRHDEVVGELEAVLHANPLREGIRGQLMVALYRSGRQADALAVYRSGREVLAEELGIDPSPELRALEVAILRQEPELSARASRLGGGEATTSDSTSAASAPLPSRLVAASEGSVFAFFGRDNELKTLDEIHKRGASEHRLSVVLVSGEPGVGKTSLVAQAARTLHDAGAIVIYGGCDEDLTVPYKPWVEAITPLVESVSDDVLRRFTETNGLTLARLVPELARRLGEVSPPPSAESDAERFMVMESVVRFLAAASAQAPLLVVLDDLHWADGASLQLLGQLAHSSAPMAVTVIGTFRDSDLSRSHPLTPLLARLRREPTVQRLPIVGFEDFEVIGLMEVAAGHRLPDEGVALAQALRRETGGNPFFVVEMILHLAQEGTFVQDDDGIWHMTVDLDEIGLPTSVREVVAQRVAIFGEDTERALSTASVIGRDFDLSVLAAVLEEDELDLSDLLEGATTAGLIEMTAGDTDRYRFVHALIQHTLYEDLTPIRRRRAHLRVAEVLEDSETNDPERLSALAHHWLAATRLADIAKAVYYARRAGQAALDAYAPVDAVAWFSQALEVLERQGSYDEHERGRLLVELGTAQNQAGIPEHRKTLLDSAAIAQRLGDSGLLVAAALGGREVPPRSAEADPERAAVIQAALGALGERDEGTRALLLASLSEVTDARDWRRRLEFANEAMARADGLNDAGKLAVAVMSYQFRAQPDALAARLDETEWACGVAQRLGDPVLRFRASFNRIHACIEVGDLTEVDRRIGDLGALVERTGLPECRWELLLTRTWRAILAGDLSTGELLNDETFVVASDLERPEAVASYGGVLFEIRILQGRISELIETLTRAAAENPALDVLRVALASAYCSLGRMEEAKPLFERDAATAFTKIPRDPTWTTSMDLFAECAVALRDREAAATLYHLILPYEKMVVFLYGTIWGSFARSLGRLAHFLGHRDAAHAHFDTALSINERIESPYFVSRTQLDYAELLRDVGKTTEATGLVNQAFDTAKQYGFAGLESRATTFSA